MASEKLTSSKGQAWFCTTGLPSDVVVEVSDMSFHLHKFPLMSKSRKLHQLITEQEEQHPTVSDDDDEVEELAPHHIVLPGFPGGAEAFEAAAKFCYGVKIELTASTAAPVRCAAEYLDMAEGYSEDNLVARADKFLADAVPGSLRESVQALKSCEGLLPLAEELGLVQRCIDSIAARAASADSGAFFGWPVNEAAAGGGDPRPVLWNGIDTGARRRSRAQSSAATMAAEASCFEDLAVLSLPMYKRVIAAMRAADPRSEVLEGSLVSYVKRSFPGLSRSGGRKTTASGPVASEAEQRELLETVISSLPPPGEGGRGRRGGMTTRLLSGLLRTANILRASEAARAALERRIASQLEVAAVDDLLMPNYSYLADTLYDVESAERILRHYLEDSAVAGGELARVGKLVDGYLAEIASDANLKPETFCNLALALPDHARVYDDGLYRAVDVYLKAHPELGEEERERVCGAIDCQKLTLEACTHAAQNERLPLRTVVQVLFFEQLQLRQAVAGTLNVSQQPETVEASPAASAPAVAGAPWRARARQTQVMRQDMESMRDRVQELERECSVMRRKIERIDGGGGGGGGAAAVGWESVTKRLGCKFRTQVCDSHERSVVGARRTGQQERSP